MVIDFFCYEGTDPYGRTFQDMVDMTDGQLEASHDVIQWLFPLHEPSNFNSECPLVDEESAKVLRANPEAQKRIAEATLRFARFLGFDWQLGGLDGSPGKFAFDPLAKKNQQNWRTQHNHNHLRITRVIRSLRLFGREEEAKQFHEAVLQAALNAGCVSSNTTRHWRMALDEDPFETLRK